MKGFIKVTDAQGYQHILSLATIKRVDDVWHKCEVVTENDTILLKKGISYIEKLIEEASNEEEKASVNKMFTFRATGGWVGGIAVVAAKDKNEASAILKDGLLPGFDWYLDEEIENAVYTGPAKLIDYGYHEG